MPRVEPEAWRSPSAWLPPRRDNPRRRLPVTSADTGVIESCWQTDRVSAARTRTRHRKGVVEIENVFAFRVGKNALGSLLYRRVQDMPSQASGRHFAEWWREFNSMEEQVVRKGFHRVVILGRSIRTALSRPSRSPTIDASYVGGLNTRELRGEFLSGEALGGLK